jgi:hypothetical protein
MLTTAGADARPQVGAIAQPKRTGGLYGRLPTHLVVDPDLAPEALFLIAYLCRHVAGGGFGCAHRAMVKEVRGGFSLGVFKRAVKQAKDMGLLDRRQGRKKKPGRDPRGRGFAIDRLTFDVPTKDYVVVERALFDGSLTPKEITCFLYLQARGDRLAHPWQIQKRLGRQRQSSRPTVNRLLGHLQKRGLAKNYGTHQAPRWGLVSLKNPTFKKTDLKNEAHNKTTYSRNTYPSHQISPAQAELDRHVGASPSTLEHENRRTDFVAGTEAAIPNPEARAANEVGNPIGGLAQRSSRNVLPSGSIQAKWAAQGVDVEELLDRYHKYADKHVEKGSAIVDADSYFNVMAQERFERSNGLATGSFKQPYRETNK